MWKYLDCPLTKGFNQEEALVEAIKHGHREIVNMLLERGTDPDVPSVPHTSAVLAAISGHNKPIIRELLQHGSHIHLEDLGFAKWQSSKDITAPFGRPVSRFYSFKKVNVSPQRQWISIHLIIFHQDCS